MMDYPNNENSNTKHIIIADTQKSKNINTNIKTNTKNINYEKERKMRVETLTWGLNEEQLSQEIQLNILECIKNETLEKNKYTALITSHIKTKICTEIKKIVYGSNRSGLIL